MIGASLGQIQSPQGGYAARDMRATIVLSCLAVVYIVHACSLLAPIRLLLHWLRGIAEQRSSATLDKPPSELYRKLSSQPLANAPVVHRQSSNAIRMRVPFKIASPKKDLSVILETEEEYI